MIEARELTKRCGDRLAVDGLTAACRRPASFDPTEQVFGSLAIGQLVTGILGVLVFTGKLNLKPFVQDNHHVLAVIQSR